MNDTLLMDWNNLNLTVDNILTNHTPSNSIITIGLTVLLYGLVAILSVAGNTIVIWTVCARTPMKSAANYLIVSIAIADILIAVIYTPLLSIYIINSSWPFGNYCCKLFEMFTSTTQSIAQISLLAVSIVWFKIVVCPSQKHLTKREGVIIGIGIWAVSFFIALPNWWYAHVELYGSASYCVRHWPVSQSLYVETFYLIFFTTWTYFFPALWFICIYAIITDKLFRTYSLVGQSNGGVDSVKNTKQSIKMMIIVTAIQIICFCPLIVLQISSKFISDFNIPESAVTYIDWIAFTTTMWKPIIYLIISDKFRRNVKVTFTWFPCIKSEEY